MPDLWWYRARAERIVDGDTLYMTLDRGMHESVVCDLRILGVNAPEMHGATLDAALQARDYVSGWVVEHGAHAASGPQLALPLWPLFVHTTKTDSFGRYLAAVLCGAGHSLGLDLISSGNAVEFMGGA